MGIASLPVTLGVRPAALLACAVMLGAQLVIVALLASWGLFITASIIVGLVLGQLLAMRRLVRDPAQFAPWYNGAGVSLYVLGMLIAAFGVRGMEGLPV